MVSKIRKATMGRLRTQKPSLDLDDLLHWFTQRTILLRSNDDAPGAFGFEFDAARGFATLDFAGAFCGGDS